MVLQWIRWILSAHPEGKSKISILLLSLAVLSPLSGENVRGNVSGIIHIMDEESPASVDLLLDELSFFILDTENPFLSGVELRMEIPRVLQQYRNSFALYLYKNVSPLPDLQEFRYQGSQVTMHILPTQSLLSFKIPLEENHSLIKDATSVVTTVIPETSFPLLLTLLPIMKGIPDISYEYPVTVTAIPIYKNKGGLKIYLEGAESLSDITLMLDGLVIENTGEYLSLEPGLHSLSIHSKSSGTAEYRVEIEKGRMTELNHQMKVEPSFLEIPRVEGVRFLVDGEEREPGILPLSPGNYEVEARLNESLSLVENIEIAPGENLLLSLDFQMVFEQR